MEPRLTKIIQLPVWLVGALISAVGYWYVVVFPLDRFDRGYGQVTWFQLNLYLSAIYTVAGLLGYAAASIFRRRTVSIVSVLLAGFGFTVCFRVLAFALATAVPDTDTTPQNLGGALVLGVASAWIARSSPAERRGARGR